MAWNGQWIRNQAAFSTWRKGSLETSPRYSDLALEFDSAAILFHYAKILPTIPHFTTCSLFGTFHLLLHTILIHWSINCEGKGGMRLAVLSPNWSLKAWQELLWLLSVSWHIPKTLENRPRRYALRYAALMNTTASKAFCGVAPHAPK
jgi:hypothetical protein